VWIVEKPNVVASHIVAKLGRIGVDAKVYTPTTILNDSLHCFRYGGPIWQIVVLDSSFNIGPSQTMVERNPLAIGYATN